MKKRICIFAAVMAILLLGLSGCASAPREATGFSLNTVVSVRTWGGGESLPQEALALCSEYEHRFSRTLPDSEIYALNHANGQPLSLSEDTARLLALAGEYHDLSGGAFDVTIAPVSELWDFSGTPRVPAEDELAEALGKVGFANLTLSGQEARISGGGEIDLGGIAKGYISQKLADFLRAEGAGRAIVNLGGNVVVFGGEQKPFSVAIQKPFGGSGEYAMTLYVSEGAVVTSGTYERGFEQGGVWYHHILDPATGMPARTGLDSVTVITDDAGRGDALSTVCFLLGEERGMALIESLPECEAVFIRKDGGIVTTSGIDRYLK